MTTKSEWLEITLEVPAEAVDFSDCGDGCGEVYGLRCAKLKVGTRYGTEMLPVLGFADGPLATQLMHKALGQKPPVDKQRAAKHYTELARQAREMMAEMDRRAKA